MRLSTAVRLRDRVTFAELHCGHTRIKALLLTYYLMKLTA